MYKKLARIGPISFGIFYAVMTLLLLIIVVLIGIFVMPLLPRPEGVPAFDMFEPMLAMVQSGEGLGALAMSIGGLLLMSFIAGLIFALLYNIVAMVTGGIKIKTNDLGYDDI